MVTKEEVDKTFKFLVYSRILRSVSLIYIGLAFSLYLDALHISLVGIGLVAALVMLFTIFVTMLYGYIGDRRGFKAELLIGEVVTFLGVVLIALSTNIAFIILGMMLAGLSGGAGSMRGSFSPGSTAFIANNYRDEKERVRKYSIINLTASISAIGGSILFAFVSPLSKLVGILPAYRYLFAVAAILIGVSFFSLSRLKELPKERKTTKIMTKQSWKYLGKVIVVNSLGGVGIGLVAPLLPLWLQLMYHVGTVEIGALFTTVYLTTAIGLYFSLKFAHKFTSLSIASATRVFSGLLLVAMAFSPTFLIAAVFWLARAVISGFGNPSRINVNIRGISNEDYGTASSIQGVATRIAQLSSGAYGYLMDVYLPLPIFVGGLFQFASGIGYRIVFGKKGSEERKKN